MAARRWGIGIAAAVLVAVLAGCTGTARRTPARAGIRVGMVTDVGGIDDLSFNMMAWRGLQQAERELGIVPTLIESRQVADYGPNLRRLAERGCRLIFAVGFALEPGVAQAAAAYPRTHFALIDAAGPRAPNVTGVLFREEEGSFLVGALAGGMTRTGLLGFVGGMEIPLIRKFEAGYRAGVKTVRPQARVIAKYTNNWEQVDRGKELALTLFEQGADIVYHASGRCGLGVIEAAKQKGPGFWAIGVDADQDYLGTADPRAPKPPSRVLTSMMKRVDRAVLVLCREAVAGQLRPGVRSFGVREDGVGLSPMTYTRSEVPAELLDRVERLRQAVAAGRVRPPRSLEELERWRPPAEPAVARAASD